MKKLFIILLLLPLWVCAQNKSTESKIQDIARNVESQMHSLKAAESSGDKKALAKVYGDLAGSYLDLSQQSTDAVQQYGMVTTDKKVNLAKSIEYAGKSADVSEDIGDMDQLLAAYRTLHSAQKANGNIKDAAATSTKILALKHAVLNPKMAKEMERKRVEYEAKKREDSIRHQKELAEEQIRQQSKVLSQQQQALQASNQSLSATQKEKEDVSKALQKSQSDLSQEKTYSEEKTKELTLAEKEKALQSANLELQQSQLKLQQNELLMKDKALEERRRERNLYLVGLVVLLAFSLLIYRSFKVQKKLHLDVLNEKKRSEELLLNILPAEVATELMQKGFADAKHFHDVTVLFTDFVNFTSLAEKMSPEQLVGELHVCFKAFDVILGKYHIEKIKTVGDAYMAVSGLPVKNPDHATDIVAAAIEIRDFMAKRKLEMGNNTFGIRLGINSGNVVAGIVGVRKFSYDIWGDTVNIAARMEQNSEEGKINISETTYQLVKDKYACEYRGKISAKNKGSIDMYFLK